MFIAHFTRNKKNPKKKINEMVQLQMHEGGIFESMIQRFGLQMLENKILKSTFKDMSGIAKMSFFCFPLFVGDQVTTK